MTVDPSTDPPTEREASGGHTADNGPRRRPDQRQEINVADLRRRLGERRPVAIDILLPPLEVVASRTIDAPVRGSLTIESIERGVTLTGGIRFGWEGDCRRCLDPVVGDAEIDVMEIFQVGAPDDVDEITELVNDTIDLVPVVRDLVLMSLPLAPLCGPDCAGPDPDRYPAVAADAHDAEQAEARAEAGGDPRWAALDDLDLRD